MRRNKKLKREKQTEINNQNISQPQFKNYSQSGASRTKNSFRGMNDVINSADEDIGDNKEVLMARSREFYMGSTLGLAAIRKIRTNVIGRGLKLKSKINNEFIKLSDKEKEEKENQIEFLWNLWAGGTECDIERFSNFNQLQSLVMITSLVDGECFVALPLKERTGELFDLKIKLIDSARCVNPPAVDMNKNIKNGVELDEDGMPIAYYFKKDEKSNEVIKIESHGKKSGRKNILVIMEKERIGQRRGIPLLAPVTEALRQITKFTEAELTNAAVSALFSVFIKYDKETTRPGMNNPLEGVRYEDDNDGDRNFKIGSGNILDLKPGQSIEFADPKRPNQKFELFVGAIAKHIGAALEIPFEVLLNSFNSSYSASRAALLEVWKMYLMRRSWFISDFCQPIFEEWLDEAVLKGYIELKGYFENPVIRKSYQMTEWYGQAQGQLNPLVEVKASIMKIEANLSTRARETSELNGTNFIDNYEQLKIENNKIKELDNVLEPSK